MANADFEPGRQTPGGFDASSYRSAPREAAAPALTPLQKKLAKMEKALPAPLRTRAIALVLAVAVLAGAAAGLGGVKLRGRYHEARSWYTVGAPGDNGYNLNDELSERANTAANVITSALNTPGLGRRAAR